MSYYSMPYYPNIRDDSLLKLPDDVIYEWILDNDLTKLRQILAAPDRRPADFETYSEQGCFSSPLQFACFIGNLGAVKVLVDAGADVLGADEAVHPEFGLWSPLLTSVSMGHGDIVAWLWERLGPDGINGPRWKGALLLAARTGQAAILNDLLGQWDGWSTRLKKTALLGAAINWQLHAVEALLSHMECDQDLATEVLGHAVVYQPEGQEFDSGYQRRGIDYIDQKLLIARLLRAGADPNVPTKADNWSEWIPLTVYVARYANLTGALQTLLEGGADPNAVNEQGESALHLVASDVPIAAGFQESETLQNKTAVRLLLDKGASPLVRDSQGTTPLHEAARGSDFYLFRLLLSSCDNETETALLRAGKNNHGESLLHYAALGGRVDILKFLLSHGLDKNEKTAEGWTPLLCALACAISESDNNFPRTLVDAIDIARILLSQGANPLVITNDGWTPLHILALYRSRDTNGQVEQLATDLIRRGVDPTARARPYTKMGGWQGIPRGNDRMEDMGQRELPSLDWAAQNGALGVVRAIIRNGAAGIAALDKKAGEDSAAQIAANSWLQEGWEDTVQLIAELEREADKRD